MQAGAFDTIIHGGTVIDGTGAPRRPADIAIAGDRIVAIAEPGTLTGAASRVDATGKIVAPGFIDVHTHDDHALLSKPDMSYKASQGVATVVAGNCGISLAPLVFEGDRPPPPLDLLGDGYRFPRMADLFDALDETPPALNAALLCGHSTLRVGAMDTLDRPATDAEIDAMRDRLSEALDAGAVGLSTGLYYEPARAAPTSEIIRLAELLGPVGGLYTTHLRDEGAHLQDSMEEAFEIGRAAGVKVVLSHHKSSGADNFGKTRESLALVERTRQRQPVTLDVYPYDASSTVLTVDRLGASKRVIVTWSVPHPEVSGRYLDDIAREMGCSEEEAAAKLLPAGAIYFMMDEEDVQRVLKYPHAIVASDGLPHDVFPHPRLWGTFPRVLGHYSRDLGLMTLEDAVHRMSGLPAGEFGLTGRGVLAAGNYADITIFDAATVIDRADFQHPTEPAAGIDTVFVNGKPVWRNGASTGERPGKALRRQALQAARSGSVTN
jgi:N-acyl-D-amino-acid deacylase